MKEVGPLFNEILHLKKIEKKAFAKAIGVTPQQMTYLLRGDAEKWKLIYFEKALKFLHVHPKTFFEDWNEPGNAVFGNIDNKAFFGDSHFSMGDSNDSSELNTLLRQSIKDKETIIYLQNQIQELKDKIIELSSHSVS